MRLVTRTVVILFLLTGRALAENWPQWRGPEGDGSSSEKNLPVTWSATENITWKAPMSAWSGSTPIVWGETIFLNSAGGGKRRTGGYGRDTSQQQKPDPRTEELSLWCLDRNTGEVRWKRSLGGGNRQRQKQNMSSPSPVTDGHRVWTMTGTGVIKSFDFQGNEKWSRDIQAEYGEFGLGWGYASSPLLYAGSLYVQVLHGQNTDDPSYVLGIDPMTGATRWRVERPTDAVAESPDSYTTPAILRYRGKTEVVITGGDYVSGHDPGSGLELWRAGGLNPTKAGNYRIIASPLVSGDMVYVSTRKDPFQAFQFGSGTPKVLWQTAHGPDVPTPVTDGHYLYLLRDNGVLFCFKARSGEVVWGPERVRPGIYSASPVLADGKIYVTSEDAVTSIVEAGPEFSLVAENELEGYTLSSPAISDGQIFLRTEQYLYCIGKRRSGS